MRAASSRASTLEASVFVAAIALSVVESFMRMGGGRIAFLPFIFVAMAAASARCRQAPDGQPGRRLGLLPLAFGLCALLAASLDLATGLTDLGVTSRLFPFLVVLPLLVASTWGAREAQHGAPRARKVALLVACASGVGFAVNAEQWAWALIAVYTAATAVWVGSYLRQWVPR